MKNKNAEDEFNKELDAYIEGKTNVYEYLNDENEELLDFAKKLVDKDFSKTSNKSQIYNQVLNQIENEGLINMKRKLNKRNFYARVASIVAVVVLSIATIQTTFAQEIIGKIVNKISIGHIVAIQSKEEHNMSEAIPKNLEGKLYNKDGRVIKVASDFKGEVYTKDGELIEDFDVQTGKIVTASEYEKEREENILIVRDATVLNDYTCFNVVLPSYLPQEYSFDRAEFYKNEVGKVENTKYINLYFKNKNTKKEIHMQQRFADDETAYTIGTDEKIESLKVKGIDVIISGKGSVDWEYKGNLYSISGKNRVAKDEVIKIVESMIK